MPAYGRTCSSKKAEQRKQEEEAMDVNERGDLHNVDGLVEEGAAVDAGGGVVKHSQRHLCHRTKTGRPSPKAPQIYSPETSQFNGKECRHILPRKDAVRYACN